MRPTEATEASLLQVSWDTLKDESYGIGGRATKQAIDEQPDGEHSTTKAHR